MLILCFSETDGWRPQEAPEVKSQTNPLTAQYQAHGGRGRAPAPRFQARTRALPKECQGAFRLASHPQENEIFGGHLWISATNEATPTTNVRHVCGVF